MYWQSIFAHTGYAMAYLLLGILVGSFIDVLTGKLLDWMTMDDALAPSSRNALIIFFMFIEYSIVILMGQILRVLQWHRVRDTEFSSYFTTGVMFGITIFMNNITDLTRKCAELLAQTKSHEFKLT